MNRSVSGLSGLPIFRCFQLTCFRTHQFRSHTPLLSILYPRPYHRFFTGYVFSKECKKDSCVPGRRFHHHADCAEALVFSLFEVDYVFFLDIKTTVSTCTLLQKLSTGVTFRSSYSFSHSFRRSRARVAGSQLT